MIFTKSATICPPALLSLTPNIFITTLPFTYMSPEDISSHSSLPSLVTLSTTIWNLLQDFFVSSVIQTFGHMHWQHLISLLWFPASNSCSVWHSSPAQYSSHSRPSRIRFNFSAYLHHARIFSIHLQCPWPCFPSACTHSIPTFLFSIVSASLVPLLASLLHLKFLLLPPTSCWPARMKLDVLLIQALSGNFILDGEI